MNERRQIGFFSWQPAVCLVLCWPAWALELPLKLLSDLSSPEFRVRETAEAALLGWSREKPEAAMNELLRQSRKASDPEVRERCLNVLKELVKEEYLKEGEGFIGISMMNEVSNVPGDPKPRQVIRVSQIVKGTAAEKAGLQLNDLIVGLDGMSWYEGPAAEAFSERIKSKKPGTKVVLEVVRDQKINKLDLILGKRPINADFLMMGALRFDGAAAEKEAQENYFRRWLGRQKEQD